MVLRSLTFRFTTTLLSVKTADIYTKRPKKDPSAVAMAVAAQELLVLEAVGVVVVTLKEARGAVVALEVRGVAVAAVAAVLRLNFKKIYCLT